MIPHQTAIRLIIGGICCAPLFACGQGTAAEGWTVSRDTIAGVEVVRNPSLPRDGVRPGPTLLWHAPSSADAARFGEWQAATRLVAKGGRIYVLDGLASRVYAVSAADGTVERIIGRRGSGPGEFERPYDLATSAAEIIVGNGSAARLERFHPDGSYLGPLHVGRLGFDLLSLPSGELYLYSLLGSDGGWGRVTAEGSVVDLVWPAPVEVQFDECTRLGGGPGVLVRAACTSPVLQSVSTDGRALREVSIDIPPRHPSPDLLDDYLTSVRRLMAESGMAPEQIEAQVRRETGRFAVLPIVRGVRVDSASGTATVWEQMPEDLGGGAARLHVIAPDGEYVTLLEFAESWVDFTIQGHRVYALAVDPDTDLVGLVAYALDDPPGAAVR